MRDCEEKFHKSKKSKTPFLRNIVPNENIPDFPPKAPRKKGTEVAVKAEPQSPRSEPPKTSEKKKKKKKEKFTIEVRLLKKMFIRGDNIVMICPKDQYHHISEGEAEAESSDTEQQEE